MNVSEQNSGNSSSNTGDGIFSYGKNLLSNKKVMIGAIVGGVVMLIIIAVTIILCVRSKRNSGEQKYEKKAQED